VVEFAFETDERVGGSEVGIAAGFEEVRAVGELQTADVRWAARQ